MSDADILLLVGITLFFYMEHPDKQSLTLLRNPLISGIDIIEWDNITETGLGGSIGSA